MLPGYNHNIRYQSEVFHVQTEDGGSGNPFVTTLLYRGGAIVSSLKSPHPDSASAEDFPGVLAEFMKEQHKGMLRRLTAGEYDAELVRRGILAEPTAAPDDAGGDDLEELVLAYLKGELLP